MRKILSLVIMCCIMFGTMGNTKVKANDNVTEEINYVEVAEKIFYENALLFINGEDVTDTFIEEYKVNYEENDDYKFTYYLESNAFMLMYQGPQTTATDVTSRATTREYYNSVITHWKERPQDTLFSLKLEYRLTVRATMNDLGAYIITGTPTFYTYYLESNFSTSDPQFDYYFISWNVTKNSSNTKAYAVFVPHVVWPDGYNLQVTYRGKVTTVAGSSSQPTPEVLEEIVNW